MTLMEEQNTEPEETMRVAKLTRQKRIGELMMKCAAVILSVSGFILLLVLPSGLYNPIPYRAELWFSIGLAIFIVGYLQNDEAEKLLY